MKALITLILLSATLAHAQNMSLNRGLGGGYADGPSLVPDPPATVTAGQELRMYALTANVYTNKTRLDSSLRVTVTHAHKIAQKPDVLAARYTPDLIEELYSLRASLVGLINRVAYDNADRRVEGMPRSVTTGYGHRRTNVLKRSERDKQNNEHRATQSALLQLKRLLSSRFDVRTFAMTDGHTHHYKLPDGQYLLCVLQPFRDPAKKNTPGSEMAIWWTTVTIEKERPKELILDETNAISWREIFETQ
jgi:hypothetical protein